MWLVSLFVNCKISMYVSKRDFFILLLQRLLVHASMYEFEALVLCSQYFQFWGNRHKEPGWETVERARRQGFWPCAKFLVVFVNGERTCVLSKIK